MNDIEILLEKAKVYFLSQNYKEAEKLFLKILEKEPDNLDALYHLGVLKEVIHDIEKAKKYYERVLEIDPENKEARERLDKLAEI